MVEHDSFTSGINAMVFRFPGEAESSRSLYHDVTQTVSALDTESLDWKPVEAQARARLLAEYSKLLDSSDIPAREKKEMNRLMEAQPDWNEVGGASP